MKDIVYKKPLIEILKDYLNSIKKKLGREKKKKNEFDYDEEFILNIQPQGGLIFKNDCIKKGDGYETNISVYGLPSSVDENWLNEIINIKDVIVTLDVADYGKEAVTHINKSLIELNGRYQAEKDITEKVNAEEAYNSLVNLYKDISQNGEVIKNIRLRIFIYNRTKIDLENKIKAIYEHLESLGCKSSVLMNECSNELKSMFLNYSLQYLNDNRIGNSMSSRTLSASYPFIFENLHDPFGTYLGETIKNGQVIFDLFHKDKLRKSYNAVILGNTGSGKSTLLKKMIVDNSVKGNITRGFDITGEFFDLVNSLGGSYISLDGTSNTINPLEIFKTSQNEHLCFSQHISKLSTFYELLCKDSNTENKDEFEILLKELYVTKKIVPEDDNFKGIKVTGLDATKYPIFSDLLEVIQSKLYKKEELKLSEFRIKKLEHLETKIKNIICNYGYLFNKHSSITDVLSNELVFFSIRNLTSLKKEIFNAQLFNILSLLWDELIKRGAKQKQAYEMNATRWEDIQRYMIIIDEASKIINSSNTAAVEYISNCQREARKYYGSVVYAMHSIRDCIAENCNSEALNAIKILFELTQDKFIFQQDNNALELLKSVFKDQLSNKELEEIPVMEVGQCILSISGDRNIKFKIALSAKEERLFKGGA